MVIRERANQLSVLGLDPLHLDYDPAALHVIVIPAMLISLFLEAVVLLVQEALLPEMIVHFAHASPAMSKALSFTVLVTPCVILLQLVLPIARQLALGVGDVDALPLSSLPLPFPGLADTILVTLLLLLVPLRVAHPFLLRHRLLQLSNPHI